MSHYTTTVRAICETAAGLTSEAGYDDVAQVLNASWDKIFEDFPIFEEAHREILCKKILRHYYMDEIAFETVGLWKLELNTKMLEIMPQYNSLYKASADIINPLYNKNLHREYDGTSTGTSKDTRTDNLTDTNGGNVVTKSDSKRTDALKAVTDNASSTTTTTSATNSASSDSYTSDTPQGSLSDVKAGKYMTNASIGTSTGSTSGSDSNASTSTNTVNNTGTVSNTTTDTVTDSRTLTKTGTVISDGSDSRTDAHTETVTGYEGSATYAELLKKYSNEIINIDMMIINELSDMFMQIW